MIELNIEQMSEEWKIAKAGKVSGTGFSKIVTSVGKPSKQADKYMRRLAGETLTGRMADGYQSAAMRRGIEMEPEARKFYIWHFGRKVRQVGLCYKDETRKVACSPDGLIDPDGGLEIKCPELETHIFYMLNPQELIKDYYQQLQGDLYVSGKSWWDIMSYYPDLDPVKLTVVPVPAFQTALDRQVKIFLQGLPLMIQELKEGKLPTPSTPKPEIEPGPNDLN